jgi:ubiquinone/menaquinone biosynthesis C-methylase UbiE
MNATRTAHTQTSGELPPNHHADHPGFAGVAGLIAAVGFAVGRTPHAELAARLTAVAPGDDVVDVGCGPGTAVRHAAALGASSVVGVDPATVMLRVGRLLTAPRRHARSRVRFVQGTAESLPLRDHSATVVWSLSTVHHWRDIDAGLAEVARILRRPGRFLALERRAEAGATGHASHGWTEEQAQTFAQRCRDAGFEAEIGHHRVGHSDLLAVLARNG